MLQDLSKQRCLRFHIELNEKVAYSNKHTHMLVQINVHLNHAMNAKVMYLMQAFLPVWL